MIIKVNEKKARYDFNYFFPLQCKNDSTMDRAGWTNVPQRSKMDGYQVCDTDLVSTVQALLQPVLDYYTPLLKQIIPNKLFCFIFQCNSEDKCKTARYSGIPIWAALLIAMFVFVIMFLCCCGFYCGFAKIKTCFGKFFVCPNLRYLT